MFLVLVNACFTVVSTMWWVEVKFLEPNPQGIQWSLLANQTTLRSNIEVPTQHDETWSLVGFGADPCLLFARLPSPRRP